MKRRPIDKAPWVIGFCLALMLSSVSFLIPTSRAQAQANRGATLTSARTVSMTPTDDGDGEGDELQEHWSDGLHAREAWLQLAGLTVGFAIAGALTIRRRHKMRGQYRHA